MGHAAGLRAGTRYAFSRDFRKKVYTETLLFSQFGGSKEKDDKLEENMLRIDGLTDEKLLGYDRSRNVHENLPSGRYRRHQGQRRSSKGCMYSLIPQILCKSPHRMHTQSPGFKALSDECKKKREKFEKAHNTDMTGINRCPTKSTTARPALCTT